MSSWEIADLCEARHNDVAVTITRLFENGVLRKSRKTLWPFSPSGGGRPTQVYDLTKRDTLVVVCGYNDVVRAKIIDRWMELEGAVSAGAPDIIKGDWRSCFTALASRRTQPGASRSIQPWASCLDVK